MEQVCTRRIRGLFRVQETIDWFPFSAKVVTSDRSTWSIHARKYIVGERGIEK